MNYIVLDLEMCKVPGSRRKEFRHKQEIIQIGAVMLDEEYQKISSFNTYVHPIYGQIDWVIENLTGICEKDVRHAPELSEALEMFSGWINGRSCRYFAWSNSDYKQFAAEISAKRIATVFAAKLLNAENWTDYQKTFGERFDMTRDIGLKEALDLSDVQLEGRAHDGLVDARNTAHLIEKLEKNPDYQLPEIYEQARTGREAAPLSFSMGSLFAGLNLEKLPA